MPPAYPENPLLSGNTSELDFLTQGQCYFYYSNVSICKVVDDLQSLGVPAPLCTMVSAQASGLAVDGVCIEAIQSDTWASA